MRWFPVAYAVWSGGLTVAYEVNRHLALRNAKMGLALGVDPDFCSRVIRQWEQKQWVSLGFAALVLFTTITLVKAVT